MPTPDPQAVEAGPDPRTFAVHNPATGQKLADLPLTTAGQVEAATRRARVAQQEWAALSFKQRRAALLGWRGRLAANRERLVDQIVAENGKPRPEALFEVAYLLDVITYYSGRAERFLRDRPVRLHLLKNKSARIVYHPLGVVGVISPWNFPLLLSFGDAVAALAAGNAVIIKPSEVTPLTPLLVEELTAEAGFPDGLVQVVTGAAAAGEALVDRADMIVFTGSTATGRQVNQRAARRLIPVVLELGGKDPMIVLRDADLERAVNGAVAGAFFNNGQTCIAVERLYVEEPIYDEFVTRLVRQVEALRIGVDPHGRYDVDLGPLTLQRQLENVERQVEDARARGATILTGGRRLNDRPGWFYAPTVLTDVTEDMLVMQEEIFGPLLPVVRVRDAQEALQAANRSSYGLSSSLWTGDLSKGAQLARRIEAGSTCVNDVLINYTMPELPFGGIKESGLGYRHGGADSLLKFCRQQSIVLDRFNLKREMVWLPYHGPAMRLFNRLLGLVYHRGRHLNKKDPLQSVERV